MLPSRLPSDAAAELKDSSGRTALFYAAINKDRRGVATLARAKAAGALEVAAALDFDDVLTECVGVQKIGGVRAR